MGTHLPDNLQAKVSVKSDLPERIKFSDEMAAIRTRFAGQAVTLNDLEQAMKGRGALMLMLLMLTPFMLPLAIPLLSVPFGLALAYMGLQLALDKEPWLPKFILHHKMSASSQDKLLAGTIRVAKIMEKVIWPRLTFMLWPGPRHLAGVAIITAGLYLCLPIPPVIPFTNWLPALAILFIVLGLMERDGLFIVLGLAVQVLAWFYLYFWWEIIERAVLRAWNSGLWN